MIERYVKDRPMLASILVSPQCLEKFHEASRRQNEPLDLNFAKRYDCAKELAPLPLNLQSDVDLQKFLKNLRNVCEPAVKLWLQKNPVCESIKSFHSNQQVLKSGVTHLFLFLDSPNHLFDFDAVKNYVEMLKKLKNQTELTRNAQHLNLLLAQISFDKKNRRSYYWNKNPIPLLRKALEDLEIRLSQLNSHSPLGKINCLTYLKGSIEEIYGNKTVINDCLQKYDLTGFQIVVQIIYLILGLNCADFFSKENLERLLKCSSIKASILRDCFSRRERISFFNQWMRILPHDAFRHGMNLSKYLLENLYGLPLMLDEKVSLQHSLDELQNSLVDVAKSQLEITTEPKTSTDVKKEMHINLNLKMHRQTFDYLVTSLIKQLYFQSKEKFGRQLLKWILMPAKVEGGLENPISVVVNAIWILYRV